MKRVVILCGKTGSGKTTIKKAILKLMPQYNDVIQTTTRPLRLGEKHGVDYNFYTEEEVAQKIFNGEIAECSMFRDWFYGTEYSEFKDSVINIGVWNHEALESLSSDSCLDCFSIYIDAPGKTRLMRVLQREINPDVDEAIRRYGADEKDYSWVKDSVDMIITNDGTYTIEELAQRIIAAVRLNWSNSCK